MIPMAKNFGEPIELEVDGHQVRVTNPEKPYFPAVGITKLEVASITSTAVLGSFEPS